MVRKAHGMVKDFSYKMNEESTRAIVVDYLKYRLDSCGYAWENDGREGNVPPTSVQAAMRRLGDDFEERYSNRFVDMIEKLNITADNASEIFTAILDEIFADGVNWGRMVALFGFSGRFAVYCFEHNMPGLVDNIVEWVSAFVDNRLHEWMETHDYWQGFLDFQAVEPQSESENLWPSFRKICGIAVGLGVLTLGAFLKR